MKLYKMVITEELPRFLFDCKIIKNTEKSTIFAKN